MKSIGLSLVRRKGAGSLVMVFLFVAAIGFVVPGTAGAQYIGSEACGVCHSEQYESFIQSGHPWKLQSPAHAEEIGLPVPSGYFWSDIWKVIGGINWKSRYVDQQGYIITKTKDALGNWVNGKNQYNLATGQWVDYNAGQVVPYTCGGCHTTGYSSDGHQDGKLGVTGTWALDGVQCERCHGAGGPGTDGMKINTSADLCGDCHNRGGKNDDIPAKGGFIEHHEQYNELAASPHARFMTAALDIPAEVPAQAIPAPLSALAGRGCVTCHDPHKKAEESVTTQCIQCHVDKAAPASVPMALMTAMNVTCVDCHMAQATKSAVATSAYQADIKTHLFRISTDPDYRTVPPNATTVATGADGKKAIDVGFACLRCHSDKDREWASENAKGIHLLGVELPELPDLAVPE